MRYILRKFIDADSVLEAIAKEPAAPLHDVYLKEGEEPKPGAGSCSAIGFFNPTEDNWRADELGASDRIQARKKR